MDANSTHKSLTVFTPTYNRAYCLRNLYESLCNQTSNDFLWLIIDDGSTDNTSELVKQFASEGQVTISYVYQENAGKHVAHNRALDICKTPLFVCVDSDDLLAPCAVEVVIRNDRRLEDERLLGMYYRRVYANGQPMASDYPSETRRVGIRELYHKYHFNGDTMIVFRTNMIGSARFPVFSGERFVTEAVLYNQLDDVAPMALFEDGLYVAEYLKDGYTRNARLLAVKNPYGTAACALSEATSRARLIHRVKAYANYRAFVGAYTLDEQEFATFAKPSIAIRILSTVLLPHYARLAEQGKALLRR